MRKERYKLEIGQTSKVFEFTSKGTQGLIKKRVLFQQIGNDNVYNLAFGDVDEMTDEFDDLVVTNNGDTEKVLATVASTVYLFSKQYPDAVIYAKGSTPVRTRLYRMGISHNFEELTKLFNVLGLLDNSKWCVYEKNKNYSAFLIKRKRRKK